MTLKFLTPDGAQQIILNSIPGQSTGEFSFVVRGIIITKKRHCEFNEDSNKQLTTEPY